VATGDHDIPQNTNSGESEVDTEEQPVGEEDDNVDDEDSEKHGNILYDIYIRTIV
jgi:hypothetical protein